MGLTILYKDITKFPVDAKLRPSYVECFEINVDNNAKTG